MKQFYPLSTFLTEYSEKNGGNAYRPVAVGRYGIRTRESIYSKELAKDYSKNKLIHKNTLTVGMGSVQIDIGVLTDDITYSVSPAYHTYKIAGVNAEYLRYCLECRNQDMFSRFVKRGSRQGKTIDLKRWLTYEIPVYDENRQQEIVDRLNRISELIEKRQEQLVQLSELMKSRFIELFGTVKDNPYHFPTATLKEVCHKITDGKHGGCEQETDSGYYYVGAREIYDGVIHYDTAPQITFADFAKDYRRCNIEQGDMVIVNTGATIGKSAIASSHLTERTLLQKSVALIKVKTDVISAKFLRYCYMANPSMYMVESASAQPNLLLSKMNATVIYLPPMELQEQFAAFVEQTDKSKYYSSLSFRYCQAAANTYRQEWMTCRTSDF
jgi:type I restriction enzyme S subunit